MTNNEKELYFYVYRKNAKFSFLQIECARHENHATTALDFPGLFIFVIVLLPSISRAVARVGKEGRPPRAQLWEGRKNRKLRSKNRKPRKYVCRPEVAKFPLIKVSP